MALKASGIYHCAKSRSEIYEEALVPNFRTLSNAEIAELARRRTNPEELQEYLAHLTSLRPGDWSSIRLENGDTQRIVKRRTSMAATSQGKKLKWRRSANPLLLVFEVLPDN